MSSQSGIVADKNLLDTLNSFQTSTDLCIITSRISPDSTVVEKGQVFNTIEELQNSLASEPLFILLKNPKDGLFVFASYVPDSSPVRAKMLYASTKNTLIRQIGSNSISRQVLITEPNELKDILIDEDISKDIALTESEKENMEIAQQQQRMKLAQNFPTGRKLISQTNGSPKQLSFNVNSHGESISSILNNCSFVSFKIDLSNEQIEIISRENVSSPSALKISNEHPSYNVYRNGSLYYFIYACPSGSKVKDRMVYASNRSGFVNYLTDQEHISLSKVIEIGDPSELEISLISSSNEEEQKQQEALAKNDDKPKFNRPSGPGRRSRKPN